MNEATVLTDGARPAVRLERQLAYPPPVVWQALTDREQLRSWFPCDVVVDGGRWEVGATISFVFPPEVIDMTLAGEVLVVDEPNTLAYTWGEETLRFELSAKDGGTLLVLVDVHGACPVSDRLVTDVFGQLGPHRAGLDQRDPNAVLLQLLAQRLRPAAQPPLRGAVDRRRRSRLAAGHAADVDEVAAAIA